MSRPTDAPDFATATDYAAGPYAGQPNKAKPSAGVIAEGLDPGAGVPVEWLNWLFSNHAAWIDMHDAVLTPTPPSTSADAPQITIKDAGGNARYLFDHLGYPLTTDVIEVREDWIGTTGGSVTTSGTLPGFSKWNLTLNSTGNSVQSNLGSATTSFPNLELLLGNTNTSSISLTLIGSPLFQASQSVVFEADVIAPTVSGTYSLLFGLNVGGVNQAQFSATNAAANWQCTTRDNGGTATGPNDSGVAIGAARLRIELHGASSAYGAVARFFINGALVQAIATHQPGSGHAIIPAIFFSSGDTTAGRTVFLGSTRFVMNRVLAAATL